MRSLHMMKWSVVESTDNMVTGSALSAGLVSRFLKDIDYGCR
jgi:hypothetical protein